MDNRDSLRAALNAKERECERMTAATFDAIVALVGFACGVWLLATFGPKAEEEE